MVAETVAQMKGEPIRQPVEVTIDVPSDAHLPADYVEREDLRLEAYRRLASVSEEAEVDDVRAEWLDRFGALPPPAEGLLDVARLRAQCLPSVSARSLPFRHVRGSPEQGARPSPGAEGAWSLASPRSSCPRVPVSGCAA